MLRYLTYAGVAAALAVPAVLCAQQSPTGQGEVAARVGDRVITLKEVDDAWRQSDPVEHMRATQMLYDGRKEALDRLIADMLIEQAAQTKGVPAEQFAKDEVARRQKPVADADVDAFYEANKARMQGKPLDAMRGAIRQFLEQQRQAEARNALVTELREDGPAIEIAIEPMRQTVDVAATDPARGSPTADVTVVEFSDYQ